MAYRTNRYAKAQAGYAFEPAHRHTMDEFLDLLGHFEWYICKCGKTFKVYVD